ncbi:endonuclease-reverse transcriptase [Elysia marginata]|uniref:Endonuclease-reverse transcriptase n=1 Tax=Elysia marginata TaxID=1093978 RepID=A0AAV4HBU3_9GAST|nr:endonuclease-reverse transcriptase [Elysia marginata]
MLTIDWQDLQSCCAPVMLCARTCKQGRPSTVLDIEREVLAESKHILHRWTKCTTDLYAFQATRDTEKFKILPSKNTDSFSILREEVEEAVKSLKKGKPAGNDNIQGELAQAGGEVMINTQYAVYQKTWVTGKWPTQSTQSLVITISKNGNLEHCNIYRNISLISISARRCSEPH